MTCPPASQANAHTVPALSFFCKTQIHADEQALQHHDQSRKPEPVAKRVVSLSLQLGPTGTQGPQEALPLLGFWTSVRNFLQPGKQMKTLSPMLRSRLTMQQLDRMAKRLWCTITFTDADMSSIAMTTRTLEQLRGGQEVGTMSSWSATTGHMCRGKLLNNSSAVTQGFEHAIFQK